MVDFIKGLYRAFFKLSNKGKATVILLGLILFYFFYTEVYTPVIRYRDFGIYIPSGYSIHGIDVSHHQGKIDWDEVSAMDSKGMKLEFAFIKASEGVGLKDSRFNENWKGIKKTGMIRGAYHFFRANRNPKLQAKLFLSRVDFEDGDLLPVLDVETMDGQSVQKVQERVLIFLKEVENKLGVKPIIYTNIDYKTRILSTPDFEDYPLWIAHYRESSAPRMKDWDFWQHSESGHVNSIKTNVDFNVFNGNERKLNKLRF